MNRTPPRIHRRVPRQIFKAGMGLPLMLVTAIAFARETAAEPSASPATPEARLIPGGSATAELPRLEVVATREDGDLVLYVDDYATNAPVTGLQVDLRIAGRSLRAARTADGLYRLPADLIDGEAGSSVSASLRGEGIDAVLPVDLPPIPTPTSSPQAAREQIGARLVAQVAIALVGLLGFVTAIIFMRRRRTRLLIDPQPS